MDTDKENTQIHLQQNYKTTWKHHIYLSASESIWNKKAMKRLMGIYKGEVS